MKISTTLAAFLLLIGVAPNHTIAAAPETPAASDVYRYVNLNLTLESWQPDKPLQTYRKHCSGTCSHGGTTGLGVGGKRHFNVTVRCSPVTQNLKAVVKVETYGGDDRTKNLDTEIDLSDLRSQDLELVRDDDGRIYRLTIRPEITEARTARKFDATALELSTLVFRSSPVILNDDLYVGQIGMSGSVVGIEIAGVASVEFSLLPLKDGKPIGTLNDGTIHIKGPAKTIMISGVRNGANPQVLDDGPYKVWVRWAEPSTPIGEARKMLGEQIEVLKERKASGDAAITDEIIKRIETFVDSGKPMLLGSSARDVRSDELE